MTPETPSAHNLVTHVGMKSFEPGDVLRKTRADAGVPFAPEKAVLLADSEVIARAFAALRALHIRGSLFRTPNGDSEIEIAMGWFSPDVLDWGP